MRSSRALFHVQDLSDAQLSIAFTICLNLFEDFVHSVSDKVVRKIQTSAINFNVTEMPSQGLAKLRHVGGWAIRKELERSRRYIRTNMFYLSSETRQSINAAHAKCELLGRLSSIMLFQHC